MVINFQIWCTSNYIRVEKLEYVLDSPKPTERASDVHNDEHVVYHKWIDDANVAQCIMLASMNIELQKQHEHMDAHTILMHLQELYDVAGRTARYEISKELFGCRMSEGSSVNDHVLKMINLIERLGQLGFAMDGELSQDLVLQSLPSLFSQFVMNFDMNKLDVNLPELHNMLKTAESNFPPMKSSVLLIGEGSNPNKWKKNPSKKKKVGEKKPVPPKAEDPKSKDVCFHCNKVGHWKRNCKVYLAELKKKKGSETTASDSGMFMNKVNMSLSQISTWVLDTACGSHICNSLQGLRRNRTLEEEDVVLRMGNGARVAAEAWTPPYTPQLNGASERRNRTLLDMVRSMMSYVNLPVFMWGYALETSAYLLNKVSFKSVPQTPYEIWKERKPSLKHVKIWGCPAYVKKVDPDKLESRSVKCNFAGYPKETLGYYFYTDHKTTTVQVETPIQTEQPSVEQPIRRSGRVSRQPKRYYGLVIENDNELSIIDDDDPMTYNETMSSVYSEKWQSAMKSEMESMYTN
ncbi:hypothetical protein AgCh_033472 [Apium graveolens]